VTEKEPYDISAVEELGRDAALELKVAEELGYGVAQEDFLEQGPSNCLVPRLLS
jgi:hypothetical protein